MKLRWPLFVAMPLVLLCAPVWALDSVRTVADQTVNGKITEVTALKVVLAATGGQQKEVPVNEIVSLTFDNEPSLLRKGRSEALAGNYADAASALERVKIPGDARHEMTAELSFYKAYVAAKQAVAGEGDIAEAGKLLIAFINQEPNSCHFYRANELVADLLVAKGSYSAAENYYRKLADTPWPDYKMRAGLAIARSKMAEGKPADAAKAFDDVLAVQGSGEQVEAHRAAATLGKLRCSLNTGKPEETVKAVEAIIAKTEDDRPALLAQAYNVLGLALKKAGQNKEAMMAFLRVDLLYSEADPDAHAEALGNLIDVFNALQQTDRALRATQTLQERYPGSRWTPKS